MHHTASCVYLGVWFQETFPAASDEVPVLVSVKLIPSYTQALQFCAGWYAIRLW